MTHILGICQRPENKPRGEPSLWDGGWPHERADSVQARHMQARIECARCPLLEACEEMLSDFEREGLAIDGIVAGRKCDCCRLVGSKISKIACRACKKTMSPQSAPQARWPLHAGEGFCEECFPHFSRKARKVK